MADNTVDNNPQQCNSISASKPRPMGYESEQDAWSTYIAEAHQKK